jgi:hypothetical protein
VTPPRRTYVVSVYEDEPTVVVEAVQRDERARLDGLDELADRIRQWEREARVTERPGDNVRGR